MRKFCSQKGDWHRWEYVSSRRENRDLIPNEYIYRCGCGHLGIVPYFGGIGFSEDVPPDPHHCEFQGCNNLATHITGVTLYCDAHKNEPDFISQRDWTLVSRVV